MNTTKRATIWEILWQKIVQIRDKLASDEYVILNNAANAQKSRGVKDDWWNSYIGSKIQKSEMKAVTY